MMSRRIRRMSRNKGKPASLSLTSLMDVFTILVLYLLVNQGSGTDITPPKSIKLPDSVVDAVPRQTVLMMVSKAAVYIQGEPVATVAEVMESGQDSIEPVRLEMMRIREKSMGINAQAVTNSTEVTIMADSAVPFKVLKKLMSTSSSAGYSKISLAVNKKEQRN